MNKTKAVERQTVKVDNANGGQGHLLREKLITDEQMGEHCGLFAKVTLEKGCTLGYHEHHGETETYYILTGKGLYHDNDISYTVERGDVVFCKDGSGHGLDNAGEEDLTFVACILKK